MPKDQKRQAKIFPSITKEKEAVYLLPTVHNRFGLQWRLSFHHKGKRGSISSANGTQPVWPSMEPLLYYYISVEIELTILVEMSCRVNNPRTIISCAELTILEVGRNNVIMCSINYPGPVCRKKEKSYSGIASKSE